MLNVLLNFSCECCVLLIKWRSDERRQGLDDGTKVSRAGYAPGARRYRFAPISGHGLADRILTVFRCMRVPRGFWVN